MSTTTRCSIGVDIGGTTIKSGVVDISTGKVLKSISVDTPNATSKDIAKLVARQVNILLHSYPEIADVGIGVPGSLNENRTHVRFPPNFPLWEDEPFDEYLRKELPYFDRIVLDNDANAATLAEATYGAGRGESHFVLVTLGTGVGGGIWSDGAIYRGKYGGAGEFGHISIDHNGPLCGCGARGCIESYIGKDYLLSRTITKLQESKSSSSLTTFLHSNSIDPKQITIAALNGDIFAKGILSEAGALLGVAMASAAKLLDIRTFIVAGGIAEAGELLLSSAKNSLIKNVFANQRDTITLLTGQLGLKAGIIGSAYLPNYHTSEQ